MASSRCDDESSQNSSWWFRTVPGFWYSQVVPLCLPPWLRRSVVCEGIRGVGGSIWWLARAVGSEAVGQIRESALQEQGWYK